MLLQACNVVLPVYNKNYMYNTSILVQEMLQYNTMKNFIWIFRNFFKDFSALASPMM